MKLFSYLQYKLFRKAMSMAVLACFILNTILPSSLAHAQMVMPVPAPAAIFMPSVMMGVKVDVDKPLNLDFFISASKEETTPSKEEYSKLLQYFLAGLTIPEANLWVNLSPTEKDRIIPDDLSKTRMGMDLLDQDYVLKQMTASFLDPRNESGKKFWDKVYAQAYEQYGTTDIPADTFNKVWVVPQKIVIYQDQGSAWVSYARLKVMLDRDYTTTSPEPGSGLVDVVSPEPGSGAVMREVILPLLEKEVNDGKDFAVLRQIVHSMALAEWYKRALKEGILGKAYADRSKTGGIDTQDVQKKWDIYNKYLETVKNGFYNFIKEEYDPNAGETVARKYISGGFTPDFAQALTVVTSVAQLPDAAQAYLAPRLELPLNQVAVQFNNSDAVKVTDAAEDSKKSTVQLAIFGDAVDEMKKMLEEKKPGWDKEKQEALEQKRASAPKRIEEIKQEIGKIELQLAGEKLEAMPSDKQLARIVNKMEVYIKGKNVGGKKEDLVVRKALGLSYVRLIRQGAMTVDDLEYGVLKNSHAGIQGALVVVLMWYDEMGVIGTRIIERLEDLLKQESKVDRRKLIVVALEAGYLKMAERGKDVRGKVNFLKKRLTDGAGDPLHGGSALHEEDPGVREMIKAAIRRMTKAMEKSKVVPQEGEFDAALIWALKEAFSSIDVLTTDEEILTAQQRLAVFQKEKNDLEQFLSDNPLPSSIDAAQDDSTDATVVHSAIFGDVIAQMKDIQKEKAAATAVTTRERLAQIETEIVQVTQDISDREKNVGSGYKGQVVDVAWLNEKKEILETSWAQAGEAMRKDLSDGLAAVYAGLQEQGQISLEDLKNRLTGASDKIEWKMIRGALFRVLFRMVDEGVDIADEVSFLEAYFRSSDRKYEDNDVAFSMEAVYRKMLDRGQLKENDLEARLAGETDEYVRMGMVRALVFFYIEKLRRQERVSLAGLEEYLNNGKDGQAKSVIIYWSKILYLWMLRLGWMTEQDLKDRYSAAGDPELKKGIREALDSLKKKERPERDEKIEVLERRFIRKKEFNAWPALNDLYSLAMKRIEEGHIVSLKVLEERLSHEKDDFMRDSIVNALGILYEKKVIKGMDISLDVLRRYLLVEKKGDVGAAVEAAIARVQTQFIWKGRMDAADLESRNKTEADMKERRIIALTLARFYALVLDDPESAAFSGDHARLAALTKEKAGLEQTLFSKADVVKTTDAAEDNGNAAVQPAIFGDVIAQMKDIQKEKAAKTAELLAQERAQARANAQARISQIDEEIKRIEAQMAEKEFDLKISIEGLSEAATILEARLEENIEQQVKTAIVKVLEKIYLKMVEQKKSIVKEAAFLGYSLKTQKDPGLREAVIRALGAIYIKMLEQGRDITGGVALLEEVQDAERPESSERKEIGKELERIFIRMAEKGQMTTAIVEKRPKKEHDYITWSNVDEAIDVHMFEHGLTTLEDLETFLQEGKIKRALATAYVAGIKNGQDVARGVALLEKCLETRKYWNSREKITGMLGTIYLQMAAQGMNVTDKIDLFKKRFMRTGYEIDEKENIRVLGAIFASMAEKGMDVAGEVEFLEADFSLNQEHWPRRIEIVDVLAKVYARMLEQGQDIGNKVGFLEKSLKAESEKEIVFTNEESSYRAMARDYVMRSLLEALGGLYAGMVERRMDVGARIEPWEVLLTKEEEGDVATSIAECLEKVYIKMFESGLDIGKKIAFLKTLQNNDRAGGGYTGMAVREALDHIRASQVLKSIQTTEALNAQFQRENDPVVLEALSQKLAQDEVSAAKERILDLQNEKARREKFLAENSLASTDPAQKDLGGVDLSMNKDNFELKAGAGNALQIAQFNIDPDAIKGLVPVIISITPAAWPEAFGPSP